MMSITRAIAVVASLLAGAALLSACAETNLIFHSAKKLSRALSDNAESKPKSSEHSVPAGYKLGKPYVIAGVSYFPQFDPHYNETGIASWYGEPFHGRDTANGERYDMNELTAAHKTMPMPSTVRVTNLENGRELMLRVNDRGPFVDGRIIDISRRGSQLLGFYRKGTAKVRVEFVDLAPLEAVAKQTKNSSRYTGAAEVSVIESKPNGDRPEITRKYLDSPVTRSEIGKSDNNTFTLASASADSKIVNGMFVQVGAFAERASALSLATSLSKISPGVVAAANFDGRTLYRVRLGPISTMEQANRILAQTVDAGYGDALLVAAQQ